MNFKISKKEIFPPLSQIQGILEKRSAFPVFAQILIKSKGAKQIQILASDTELCFSAKLPAIVSKQGVISLNGKKLFEIVKELSEGEISIEEREDDIEENPEEESYEEEKESEKESENREEQKDTKVFLRQNKSLFKIKTSDPKEFPEIPPLSKKKKESFLADEFLDMIDKTLYCVAVDESRYHLTGVYLERLKDSSIRFVATDGHRLSFVESNAKNALDLKQGIIIPKKGLQEIRKMLAHSQDKKDSLDFYIEKPRIAVQFQNQVLSVRLIEGEYPNYKSLLPDKKRKKQALVPVKPFLHALRRISVLTSARFKGVNFTFEDQLIRIDFEHPDVGSAGDEVPCKYKGEKIKIRFNSRYIMDVLQSFDEDQELKISLEDSNSSGIIQAKDNSDYTCLVMPMKI